MSWSFNCIGTSGAVRAHIDKSVESYGTASDNNRSAQEVQRVAPHIKALVAEAIGDNKVVRLFASGHGTWKDGVQVEGHINLSIEILHGFVE
jgi:hypothetical protein